jgi:hypothetical protein
MQQVIYIDADDDLPAIRHLLEGAQGRQILLVVPKGYQALRDTVNLRVLRRYAADLALEVALVTRDSRTRQMARAEGVAVVSSLRQGRRGRWRAGTPVRSSAERAAAARVAALRAGRGDVGYGDRAILWAGRILGVLLFAFFLAVVVLLAALLIPEARVTVVPYRQPAVASLELRADPDAEKASLETRTIPARIVEVQVDDIGQTSTVSKKDAPDAPANGTAIFINQTMNPVEVITGTLVRTTTGTTVRFKTVTEATLAPSIGATAEVQIESLEPGPVGNVPAATINEVETSGLRGKVRVTNDKPTQGGGVRQVGVVTRADMERLKAELLERLRQKAYGELQAQLTEQEMLPPESMTFEIMSEVYDQFLEAEADVLNMQMRVLASGTAVDVANAKLLAYDALQEQIPSRYELTSDQVTFDVSDQVRIDGRRALLDVSASAQLVADVRPGEVRSAVAGLPVDEAVAALVQSFALDDRPVVELQPDWIKRWEWLNRVPLLPFRIQVLVME